MSNKAVVIGAGVVVLWGLIALIAYIVIQNIPRATCNPSETSHDYDVSIVHIASYGDQPPLKRAEMDVRVSGEDFHAVFYPEDKERREEYIVIGDDHYQKKPGDVWKVKEEPRTINIGLIWWMIDNRPYYMGFNSDHILCPVEGEDFRLVQMRFEETLGPEYVWGPDWRSRDYIDPAFAAEVPPTKATWVYWPTNKGYIYQSHQLFVWGEEEWERTETTASVSGVGDPNVITAPTLEGT